MASTKGIHLLKMPELGKEEIFAMPTPQLYKPGHTAGRLKLLSLPQKSQEHAQKHVNLVQIPIKAMHPHASLLKLPRKLIEKEEENRKPVLIDSRNIKNGSSPPQSKILPLLKKPRKTYEAEMIRLPLSKDLRNKQKAARLIALPVQIKTDMENHHKRRKENTIRSELKDDTENKTRTLKDFEGTNLSNWQDVGNKEKSQKEYADDLKRAQRRKRQKMERNSGNSNQKCIETIKKKSYPDKISIETQTTATSSKKIRKSRHKVNLMTLLEQAAFLFDSDVSDEEINLNTPEKRSHLVNEEAYSTIQDQTDRIYAVSNDKESHAADRRVKKPLTTEQLLLDNFREERLINSANLLDNSDLAQFLEKPVSKMGDLQTKQPTKSDKRPGATNHDSLGLTSSDLKRLRNASAEIPNSSAGLSWNEVVSLSRNVSTNHDVAEMSKKENKGTQVMNEHVETNMKEQVSQTDFTFATDVNKLILEHQEDQVKIQGSSVIQKSSERVASKVESEYPWEHIGRSNSPDIADFTEHEISQKENDAFQTTKRRKTSAGNAVVINRVDSVAEMEESKVPVLHQLSQVQPASGVHFAPEILLEMKVQDHHIETKENEFDKGTKLLNVVDISKPAADNNVADIEKDNIVVNDIAVEKLSEYVEIDKPTIKENRKIKETFERSLSLSEYSFQEKQSPPVEEDVDQIADSQVERSQIAHKLDRILAEGPKDRLHNNLRNFSVQLDALGDLHDHLERELKHSASLMQTVGTLHSSFFENDVPARSKEYKEPKSLYNNNKRRKSQSFEDSKTQNKPIAEDMFLSDNAPDDIYPASYSNEQAHIADEETDKDPDEGKVEEFVEELQDTSLDMTNNASESINGSHDEIGDSVSGTSIADDIDATNSPTPSQGEVTEDVVQLANEDDEIRLRLTQRFPTPSQRQIEEDRQIKERTIREKLENKRKALRDWMKKKRSEQHTKYRAEVVEKRQKETRPFVGLQNAAKFASQTSAKESKNKKKILSEELYQDRINDANKLMSDIFATQSEAVKLEKSNRPFSVPTDAIKRKRNSANSAASRGKKLQRNNSSRTSTKRSGKKFMSFKDRAEIREKEADTNNELRKEAGKKWLIDNLSPSWKQSSFGNDSKQWQTTSNIGDRPNIENVNFFDLENSLEIPLLTSSRSKYSPNENRFLLDLGELSYSETPDLRSGRSATRRSVEGRDFVTRTSMEQYRMKAAKSVRTSLKEYSANTQDISGENDGLSAPFDYSFMTTLDMTGGYMKDKTALKNVSNQFGNSVDDEVLEYRKKKNTFENSSDAQDINAILTQYGLLDDEINQHNSSETSQLLAEANLILEESGEEEAAFVPKNDSVDWDEVNMILKQN